MKYLLAFVMVMIGFQSPAKAGFYDSDYFEPTLGCLVGAAAGYATSKTDQAMNAAVFCAGGIILGIVGNSYYRKKIDIVEENELASKQDRINRKKVDLARSATLGDTSKDYSLILKQVEDAQMTPGGEAISPSERYLLDTP